MGVESIKNACKGAKVCQNALKRLKFARFFTGFERFLMIFFGFFTVLEGILARMIEIILFGKLGKITRSYSVQRTALRQVQDERVAYRKKY